MCPRIMERRGLDALPGSLVTGISVELGGEGASDEGSGPVMRGQGQVWQ